MDSLEDRSIDGLVRRMPWSSATSREPLLTREWLVTNGLGGYASGTVSGVLTRRYHGILIAALPAPLGRRVMLDRLSEVLRLPGGRLVRLGAEEKEGEAPVVDCADHLEEFRLEAGLPVWRYRVGSSVVEKHLYMPYRQNTVHLTYRLLEGEGVLRLKVQPSIHFRQQHAPVSDPLDERHAVSAAEGRYEVSSGPETPPLRLYLHGKRSAFTVERGRSTGVFYRAERARGYESCGDLFSPGYFRADLERGSDVTLVASTEGWETILALEPADALAAERLRRARLIEMAHPAARTGPAAELVLAADQFLIAPLGRVEDAARALAAGDEVRTVIAGYHWFTDWGRDTMISLEGLALATGRTAEARDILRTFSHHVMDGLIPNLFPEGEKEGLYHTADATLWFFHALDRYLRATRDRLTLALLLPRLVDIAEHHLRGTRFGIGVDPRDGLLRQGEEGYQLTWMDAKVGDWVVTPRRGKAVEINALWHNALTLLSEWVAEERGEPAARPYRSHADRARDSFNRRFWYEAGGHLYDVVDGEGGDDPACRPNQLLAISLPHPVLERTRWEQVLAAAERELLTPVGLRTLSPRHPEYKPKYDGDLRARDAAYHQGTAWAWLIGPFLDAWRKVHPEDRAGARRFLEGFLPHFGEAGMGTISEVFDAEEPYCPRGCISQAWSVAEVLRSWVAVAR